MRKGNAALTARITQYLQDRPMELAALLDGGPCPAELAALLPPEPPWDGPGPERSGPGGPSSPPQGAPCACGKPGCPRAAAAPEAAAAGWAADPLLRLAALDLAPEALARAVFAAWAAGGAPAEGDGPPAAGAAPGPPPQSGAAARSPRVGPSIAEWLGTAAAQGRLHEPGSRFREARRREVPPQGSAAAAPGVKAVLAELLPGVPAAADALDLIAERVSERASERARKTGRT
ncbi:hypothetical protein [Paenibacillus caui]|uniref:hypothetical protein n=1 Tax=Paenibacillus caui TaxID=2873927 RepID=UPI001CA7FC0D|nr:hypothetical protein [Paenibacillus caui]